MWMKPRCDPSRTGSDAVSRKDTSRSQGRPISSFTGEATMDTEADGKQRPPGSRRSARTALEHKSRLGWGEICQFHPLGGQRFQVLKERRTAGIDTLLLRESDRGSFSIAREWTDWADTSPSDSLGLPQRRLGADSLIDLATHSPRATELSRTKGLKNVYISTVRETTNQGYRAVVPST